MGTRVEPKKKSRPRTEKTSLGPGYSKCCVCGKIIYTAYYDMDNWVYKYCGKFCCSYACAGNAESVVRQRANKQEKPRSYICPVGKKVK